MAKCLICSGSEFEVSSGARICLECGAHELNFLDLEFDVNNDYEAWTSDPGKYLKLHHIEKMESDAVTDTYIQNWTSFEAMNIILLEWIKALMHIGATEKLKDIAFKLWVTYLKKRKIAFSSSINEQPDFSPDSSEILSIRDAKILRNIEVLQCKAKRKRRDVIHLSKLEKVKRNVARKKLKSSEQSPNLLGYLTEQLSCTLNTTNMQENNEDDRADNEALYERSHFDDPSIFELKNDISDPIIKEDKNVSNSGKTVKARPSESKITLGANHQVCDFRLFVNPTFFSIEKLVSLLYLAILLAEENILLSDLLRWCKEGHIPFFTAANLLNDGFEMTKQEYQTFFKIDLLSAHSTRSSAGMMANFLSIQALPLPSFQIVIDKFSKALNLPNEVATNALKAAELLFSRCHLRTSIPGIEIYCAVLIIFTLKTACGLDGQQEYLLSEFADNFNEVMKKVGKSHRIFSWCKWQSYMNHLQWWLNEVDVSKTDNTNCFTSIDTHRLSQNFWTYGIWQNKIDDNDALNNWEVPLAENLLHLTDNSIKNMLGKDPLFKPYFIPYTEQIKQYITEAFKRDSSPRMKIFLKIAKELDATNFINHKTYLEKEDLDLKFKELNINVKVFFVPLSERGRIFNLVQEENEKKRKNSDLSYLILPDPIKKFWIYENVLSKKHESSIFNRSNFMWLVKQLSNLCETSEKDILYYYRATEYRYINYLKKKKANIRVNIN